MSKESSVVESILAVIVGGAAGLLLIIGAATYGIVSTGVVVCYLWKWFMVPLGLVEIGFAHAAGISLFVGLISMGTAANHIKAEYKETSSIIIGGVSAPWFALLFGYIIHSFM